MRNGSRFEEVVSPSSMIKYGYSIIFFYFFSCGESQKSDFVVNPNLKIDSTNVQLNFTLPEKIVVGFNFNDCFCTKVDSGINIVHYDNYGLGGESLILVYNQNNFNSSIETWSDVGHPPVYTSYNQLLELNANNFDIGDTIKGQIQIDGSVDFREDVIKTYDYNLNGQFHCLLKDSTYNFKSYENDLRKRKQDNTVKEFIKLAKSDSVTSVLELHLNNLDLKSIPSEIANFINLEVLELNGNDIEHLNPEILKNLKVLRLRNNQIKSLPFEISRLNNLVELDLGSNQLTSLPITISEIQTLEKLNLSSNPIEEIPNAVFKIKKLKELDLSLTRIKEVPNLIKNLHKIETLKLSSNDQLAIISQEIFNLDNLEELQLPHNRNSLKFEGNNLSSLKSLWIPFDQLYQYPQSLKKLKSLRTLFVYYSYKNDEEEKDLYYSQKQWLDSALTKASIVTIVDNSKYE